MCFGACGRLSNPSNRSATNTRSVELRRFRPIIRPSLLPPSRTTQRGSQNLVPDDHPLAGAQNLSLGSPEISRSYWQPHVRRRNGRFLRAGLGDRLDHLYFGCQAALDVHKISGHSDLTLGYTGGGTLSNDGSIGNSVVQALNFGEKLTCAAFSVAFLDSLDYLPETGFGYGGGLGGGGLGGGGSLALQEAVRYTAWVDPSGTDSDYPRTAYRQFLHHRGRMEAQPRSSFTLLGGYSLLRYLDNNLLDGDPCWRRLASTISSSAPIPSPFLPVQLRTATAAAVRGFNDHIAHLSYAQRITGRLAFQLSAGPEYTQFDIPVLTGSGVTAASSSTLSWSLGSL